MKVSIVGTGYVGLVSGVCLAEKGNYVNCVDLDQQKVDKINQAIPPIYEKDLESLLKKNINVNFKATTDLYQAVLETDITLIAVGTPFDGTEIDLSYIKEASRQVGIAIRDKSSYHVIVVKSTVVPGTTDDVVIPILEHTSGRKAGSDFGVGMNPEFLREGNAIQDFMFPDRIVLGGNDSRTINILEEVYSAFDAVDKIRTNNRTAEMIKYASNSLLATMISFSNEIGNLCCEVGNIDVIDVMKGIHLDKRLSPIMPDGMRITPDFTTYLEAGCGFGGSCFPKDVKALIAHGEKVGSPMILLDSVMKINIRQPEKILSIVRKHYPVLNGIRVAVLGLAFKPGTDDMRESPAIPVVKGLQAQNALIRAFDPIVKESAIAIFGNDNIMYFNNLEETIRDADVIVLLSRCEEFRVIPELIRNAECPPLCIDGRRMLDKKHVARYEGIGFAKIS